MKVVFEKFTDPAIGKLLDELAPVEASLDPDSDDAALIRLTRRDYEKAVRVPVALRAEMARASSEANPVWVKAKAENDFASFLPMLQRNVELKLEYAELVDDGADERYDVLLDDFEPQAKTAEVRAVFEELKPPLVALIAELRDREVDDSFLTQNFPEATARWRWRTRWSTSSGTAPTAGGSIRRSILSRQARAATTSASRRTTTTTTSTRSSRRCTSTAMASTAISSRSISSGSRRAARARSGSTSRRVGCGRTSSAAAKPFWQFFYPRLQATYPEQFGSVELDRFLPAINRSKPGLIRIDADEVTYGMHVMLRFELEQDIVEGRVELKDLPTVWNQKMWEYLGVEVPDDSHGVLQDVHWSGGMIGYFSTYLLGTVMSVQIWEAVLRDVPDLSEQVGRGEFAALREWLGSHIHELGRKYTSQQVLERATGSTLQAQPYLDYLRSKYVGAVAV